MRVLDAHRKFLKDVKRMQKRGYDLKRLQMIVEALAADLPLPPNARPHKLVSQANDVWDVHIAPDWILLYEIDAEVLTLRRTGTHSDLF